MLAVGTGKRKAQKKLYHNGFLAALMCQCDECGVENPIQNFVVGMPKTKENAVPKEWEISAFGIFAMAAVVG